MKNMTKPVVKNDKHDKTRGKNYKHDKTRGKNDKHDKNPW